MSLWFEKFGKVKPCTVFTVSKGGGKKVNSLHISIHVYILYTSQKRTINALISFLPPLGGEGDAPIYTWCGYRTLSVNLELK